MLPADEIREMQLSEFLEKNGNNQAAQKLRRELKVKEELNLIAIKMWQKIKGDIFKESRTFTDVTVVNTYIGHIYYVLGEKKVDLEIKESNGFNAINSDKVFSRIAYYAALDGFLIQNNGYHTIMIKL